MAGLTSGKKILLKTMAAASEYSWKSMNSIAVPSHPDTAALVRSRVVRCAAPCGGASTLLIIDVFLAREKTGCEPVHLHTRPESQVLSTPVFDKVASREGDVEGSYCQTATTRRVG